MSYQIKPVNVEVRTSEFFFAHSRQPRGAGMWYFEIGGEMVGFNGNYGDCKREAQAEAAKRNVWFVKVCS